jgi:hypothetical protein
MTDKQIIIDGIDVSGCPHLIEDYQWWNIAGREEHDINRCALGFDVGIGFEENYFCKENPNCYYKQLKRKEQECEELKDKLRTKARGWANVNDQILKEVDQIKADNEELTSKCSQLKQTLAEIKSILEYYENAKIGEKQEDGSYKLEFTFSDIATPYCINYDPKPAREALRKINEVEDES